MLYGLYRKQSGVRMYTRNMDNLKNNNVETKSRVNVIGENFSRFPCNIDERNTSIIY